MPITDKSAIPLNVHDLRVVEGERCFLDRRINLRLGYDRDTYVRRLIERNKDDFEARFGEVRRRDVPNSFARKDRPETEYWLTKGQVLWVCRKSDARNADDVMEEVIKVFLAVDAGAPIPDTPWTDALLAPDKPTVTRGDGNIVHVKHEEPLGDLFELPPEPIVEARAPAHPFWCEHELLRLPKLLFHRWCVETDNGNDYAAASTELIALIQAVLEEPLPKFDYQLNFLHEHTTARRLRNATVPLDWLTKLPVMDQWEIRPHHITLRGKDNKPLLIRLYGRSSEIIQMLVADERWQIRIVCETDVSQEVIIEALAHEPLPAMTSPIIRETLKKLDD